MKTKPKFPRALAVAAAREILQVFVADRVVIAGSLRRGKQEVGDIEIVYIPKTEKRQDPRELFPREITVNHTDDSLDKLICSGVLCQRANQLGVSSWGEKNKYAFHLASRIPVDFFATTEKAWWNYLVCRTGSAEHNIKISTAAQAKGWSWHPYAEGFTNAQGTLIPVTSEQALFDLLGLPYLDPWQR